MSKIIICGLNGSGKTTLGKKLADVIKYKHIDIEDYYFVNNNDYKYENSIAKDEVVKKIEKDFNKYNNIVFTACKGDYGNLSSMYDFAVYIRLDKETRLKRVKERSYKQFGDRILENGDLYEKENCFFNKIYKKDELETIEWLKNLKCNKIELDGLKSTNENIKIILSELNIF